ncbi:helix-turn-helix domain-containing protein [Flavobacterium album]|nr:helix-turn-helix domain-containing protein [Flavobacterium album]
MEYKVYTPCDELTRQIRYHWSLDAGADAPKERERIFPDGCIELIFNYGELFMKHEPDGSSFLQPRGIIYGQIKSFIEVAPTGKVGLFSTRFNPAGLQPFLNFDVNDFTGKALSVGEIWGDEGIALEKEMIECADNEARKATVEAFLLKRLESIAFDTHDVEYYVDALLQNEGTISIDKLADELSIGKRQLERKFIAAVGLSPKFLSRIIRFQNTLQLIEKKEFISFTNVAYDGGFYDQAHFIKDFKEFTGLNPKQYFSENLEMAKHFVFDE